MKVGMTLVLLQVVSQDLVLSVAAGLCSKPFRSDHHRDRFTILNKSKRRNK